MPKEKMVTTKIKTARPVTDSELLTALKNSMGPIFAHFEEEILKGGGKVLEISVSFETGRVKMQYGVHDLDPKA